MSRAVEEDMQRTYVEELTISVTGKSLWSSCIPAPGAFDYQRCLLEDKFGQSSQVWATSTSLKQWAFKVLV